MRSGKIFFRRFCRLLFLYMKGLDITLSVSNDASRSVTRSEAGTDFIKML